MSLLEITELTSGYARTPIVRGVSLTVAAGEVVALVGANGAGKSTTLLTVSGLTDHLSGDIRFDGQSIGRLTPVERARAGIAHVPEDRSLFPSLTGAETLRLAAPSREAVAEVYDHFPALRSIGGRRVAALSGGEQQMLALAHALVRRPRLLIVDEMSLGLAPRIVAGFFPVLRRVAEDARCAILLVEQHVKLALAFADRAYVMSDGRVAASGPAAEIRERTDLLRRAYLGGEPQDGQSAGEAPP